MNHETPQSSGSKRLWLLPLTMLLAGVFLYLALRQVNWNETFETLRSGNMFLLGLTLVIFSISCLMRGLRWRVLLSSEKPVSLLIVFWSMMAGYLGNAYLPARAGEIIRSVMVGQRAEISKSFSLATALTERIADAVILVSVSAAALLTLTNLPDTFLQAIRVMAIIGAVGAVLVFIAPRIRGLIQTILQKLPLPDGLREKLTAFVINFLNGASALQNPARLVQFLLLSACIWSLDTVVGLVTAEAFGLSLTPAQVFILLAALGISSAIPSTPGYVGVYQLVAVTVLVPFGLTESQALAFILAFQGVNYLGITLWGLLGLWGPGIHRKTMSETT